MEQLPKLTPKPGGKLVTITEFVDASHVSDKRTRRSYTGCVIFVNRAPFIFYSK